MFKKLVWYIRFFRYCWSLSKLREDLEFFEGLPDGHGKKFNAQIRQVGLKVKKATARKDIHKRLLLENEMYNALNDLEDENFAEEISVLSMMLILWGMQRTYTQDEE